MTSPTLSQRLHRLEAIEAVRRLVGEYARGADRRNDPCIMGPLFHEDAIWEAAGFGRYVGRDAITTHLAQIGAEQIVWSLHYMVSPVVEVNSDLRSARCHWYLWELAHIQEDGVRRAHWIGGWYNSELTEVDGIWRFLHVNLDLRLVHSNGEDWVPAVA
ncbi:nuclear transport factor 2 family protein [Cupriavidus sp. AcVe19-6a]|uniref:nuclear transport factor 2 family protein n=1 Tax=Cupriavidus sp. AcVe19-6a TaxID=2821358 RepID=UPI001AE14329|nr:nuclear transport factor 2 family protein [Cupriavidus sp. AcVe19-6a]MBP0639913.1 nuclear transport factor 2 family protein [Cupriavidus sp. AcVe19-6a]